MSADSNPQPVQVKTDSQVSLKKEGEELQVVLPGDNFKPEVNPTSEVLLQLKQRLNSSEHSWQPETVVHLVANNQLLDSRQLQAISDSLGEAGLLLKRVSTSRRQTAVAAAAAGYSVEQEVTPNALSSTPEQATTQLSAEPLYLQTTVRSGVEIRHPGTVVILGDVNPGGAILAEGDVFVWGRLRGLAHAGAGGNRACRILALAMQPTQLRIADAVARPPAQNLAQPEPELAYATQSGIRLTRALDFLRTHSLYSSTVGWIRSSQ